MGKNFGIVIRALTAGTWAVFAILLFPALGPDSARAELTEGAADAPPAAASEPAAQTVPASPLSCPLPHSLPAGFKTSAAASEESTGITAQISAQQILDPGQPCAPGAPQKFFDVVAINLDITLNKFGDHDPQGKMYALASDLAQIRVREVLKLPNTGLGNDPIQPLTIRANLGDCVNVRFTNLLDSESASVHIHDLAYDVNSAGSSVGFNPSSLVRPSETANYRWFIDPAVAAEGAHYFHSHGKEGRRHGLHGLFGALVAEPPGSTYLNSETGEPLDSGWSAMIVDPNGPDFREHAIFYHEVGDENFHIKDQENGNLPQVDPLIHSYRPGARALNYRTEPHGRRLGLQQERFGLADESQAYGSYTFGEPAQPIPRSYVGDPEKQRLVGGTDLFHVHHLHGGSVRWRFQPKLEDDPQSLMSRGFTKNPPLRPKSNRIDVQTLGTSETFNAEIECGAGGCQQAQGDYLFHCHIADHYLSGMWSFWRTYNTLQNAQTNTDGMGPLAELPDRPGRMKPAVDSAGLIGVGLPDGTILDQSNIEAWIERFLPSQGVPGDYDASVFDWIKTPSPAGPLYSGEPETTEIWPNFSSPTPGERPKILFDPVSARPAYPMLRPHLGKRPPFAPDHGGAPGIGLRATPDNPKALFPTSAPSKHFNIKAIELPIQPSRTKNDPNGMIFVLAEEEAAIRNGSKLQEPLTIRANVGDAVTHTFVNEIADNPGLNNPFSKVNMHVHFVQFDPQASDGVITGMSFEQSVRPYRTEGITLTQAAPAGSTLVRLSNTSRLHIGALLGVGLGTAQIEQREIMAIQGDLVTLDQPLEFAHAQGQFAGNEFVNYAWFVDALTGQIYWHDHVNGLVTWAHGLFASIIAEPPGSTYHDPRTGEEIRSGAIADIRTSVPYAPGKVDKSFRELALYLQDRNAIVGSTFNLKAEPWAERLARNDDPSLIFSSVTHGDPLTPLPRAYVGDPFVIRTLVGSMNELHTFHLSGHRFFPETFTLGTGDDPVADSQTLAIAERFTHILDQGAGSVMREPGDYIYFNGVARHFEEGMWGIIRVHDTLQPDLKPLPDIEAPPSGPGFPQLTVTGGRPPQAPAPTEPALDKGKRVVRYDVVATEVPLPGSFNFGNKVKLFALAQDEEALKSGRKAPEPLILRINEGDVMEVRFTNHLPSGRASFHAGLLQFDPQTSLGMNVGFLPDQTVAPGESRIYRFFADRTMGGTLLADFGDPVLGGMKSGLYGSTVVLFENSEYRNPSTGEPIYADSDGDGFLDTTCAGASCANTWEAMVENSSVGAFRSFAFLMHEDDAIFGSNIMPYQTEVQGRLGINYRRVDMGARLGGLSDDTFSSRLGGDPVTPVFRAYVGDPTIVHSIHAFGEQAQVRNIEGHRNDLGSGNSNQISSRVLGPASALNAVLEGGAGGLAGSPGDYLYMDHRLAYTEGGMWGLLRVFGALQSDLVPLPERPAPPTTTTTAPGPTTTTTVEAGPGPTATLAPVAGLPPSIGAAAVPTGLSREEAALAAARALGVEVKAEGPILRLLDVFIRPNPFTPDGDGKNDFSRVNFILDRAAKVTVEIFSFQGREKLLEENLEFPAGLSGIAWTGTDDRGKVLPTGNYRFVLKAAAGGVQRTFAGVWRIESEVSFQAFFFGAGILQLTRVVASPATFTPDGDRRNDLARIRFNLSRPSLVAIDIFGPSGKIKTFIGNVRFRAGTSTVAWTGTDARGKVLPPGDYRFLIRAAAGGVQRTFTGIFRSR